MYQLDLMARIRSRQRASEHAGTADSDTGLNVSPTVWKLGFTSLFTDISSEMVGSILPVYFVLYLHFSTVEFGFLDGISQGAAVALLSLFAGAFADRWRRQKEVATAGYALSAISRVGLLAAGKLWLLIAVVLALDRVGKGIRTAPRDAMISLSSAQQRLATSFAVHRALDTCGAVCGPLMAFLLMRLVPDAFNIVLMMSVCIALIGLGVIVLLVDKPASLIDSSRSQATLRTCAGLLKHRDFRVLAVAGGVLGMATISDGFVYLLLQKKTHSPVTSIPLYTFLTAIFYLVLSVPAGRMADRWGRTRVFLLGYGLLASVYTISLLPEVGGRGALAAVALLGAYYAATDGVLAAMTSATLEKHLRTTGLAMLNTASSLSRLVSSVLFGWLWSWCTVRNAVGLFLVGLTAAMILSAVMIPARRRPLA